ncbi:MAG: cyclic nucleotide-binding domain-containing protein [Verrucomicrobiota bacterium]
MELNSRLQFPALDTDALRARLPDGQIKRFAAGDVILEEGAQADCCYLVLSGRVQVSRRRSSGKVIKLAEVPAGEFFGEMGLLSGLERSADAIALCDAEVVQLLPGDLSGLIEAGDPLAMQLGYHFASTLADRCGQMLQLLAESPATSPKKVDKKDDEEMPMDVRQVLHEVYSLWAI